MKKRNTRVKNPLTCRECGKLRADAALSDSLSSYYFESTYCSCPANALNALQEPLTAPRQPDAYKPDSLASFCPACGLETGVDANLGAITGVFSEKSTCRCRNEDFVSGDGMAERFWKLKEAEADKVFASATMYVPDGRSATAPAIDLLPGAIIGKIYRIVDLLGKGGMGEVYRAYNTSLGRTCALKLIPPQQVTDTSWLRFQNEARAIAGLDHTNIVKVTDLGLHEGCLPFYAMEYVEGQSLMERLKARGPLPLKSVLDIFIQLCDGLSYAHRLGVVHRDLKPGNIMLSQIQTDKFQVKILDFGLVKLTRKDRQQQSLTKVGEVFGTPYYMSPEQCFAGKIDGRSDIYSVGCAMFEALTGQVPFRGPTAFETIMMHQSTEPPTLASIAGGNVFPESLENVLERILRKNPAERYQTMTELKIDLEKVKHGEVVRPFVSAAQGRYTQQSKDAQPLREDELEEESPNPTRISLELAIPVSIVLLLGAIFVIMQFPVSKNFLARTRAATKPINLADEPAKPVSRRAIPAAAMIGEPFAKKVRKEDKDWRVFHFPEESLGEIRDTEGSAQKASGSVEFPQSAKLSFSPNSSCLECPGYFKRFQSGEIDTLIFPVINDSISQKQVEESILNATALPGLRAVSLANYSELSDKALSLLDRFDTLTTLTLGSGNFDTNALARLTCIKKLVELNVEGYHDLTPVLKALRSSPALKIMSMPKSPVDLEGVQNISSLSNLEQLYLDRFIPNNTETTEKALNMLNKNGKLQALSIRRLAMCNQILPLLKSCPQLRRLSLSSISSADKSKLSSTFPGLRTSSYDTAPSK